MLNPNRLGKDLIDSKQKSQREYMKELKFDQTFSSCKW